LTASTEARKGALARMFMSDSATAFAILACGRLSDYGFNKTTDFDGNYSRFDHLQP
jgi:hypothetical protein